VESQRNKKGSDGSEPFLLVTLAMIPPEPCQDIEILFYSGLLIPQSIDRIEECGFPGGIEPEEYPDGDRKTE
jgi:hypothetical protein